MERLIAFSLLLLAGYSHASQRIVGGEATNVDTYPPIVQVDFMNRWTYVWSQNCAATIINNLNVLSAAHCFYGDGSDPTYRRIRAGATYRNTGGYVVYVYRVVNHPSYDPYSSASDISVVRLYSPLTFGPVIQPSAVPPPDTVITAGLPVVQVGWGLTGVDESPSSVLLYAQVYTVGNDYCRERYASVYPDRPITSTMICTGALGVGGSGSCGNDAGGPVFYGVTVVGVISWVDSCGSDTFPAVNTAVAPYTNWIVETAEAV